MSQIRQASWVRGLEFKTLNKGPFCRAHKYILPPLLSAQCRESTRTSVLFTFCRVGLIQISEVCIRKNRYCVLLTEPTGSRAFAAS